MALGFESYYTLIKGQLAERGLIDSAQQKALHELDVYLEELSGERNLEFWEDLESHPDWQTVREKARECLRTLGKENYGLRVQIDSDDVSVPEGQELKVLRIVTGLLENPN